ncbi:FISUMP domain-containing protein [Riemerella columbina]|uniref:FISUMP domain-containing protein n=1 Tax=Riemerella columbina TaxID=103810 RepID=UPI0003A89153|nr:FISUMP domain-containing protein [Riemerella columbina]
MKKNLFLAMVLPMAIHAQYNGRVGINTSTPDATLQVSRNDDLPETRPQGVTFPNFSTEERSKFQNVSKGMLIYNTDKNCIEMYMGYIGGIHQWTCNGKINDVGEVSNPPSSATATLGAIQDYRFIVFQHKGKDYRVKDLGYTNEGVAPNEEISISIPYTNAQPTNGAYTAFEQTLPLKNTAGYTQDFKLYYPAGNFTGATGTIQAKLKNVSGAVYMPELYAKDGVYRNLISGANAYSISLNGGVSTTSLKVQDITAIPDRCFDTTTSDCVGYGASVKEHDFLYIPIKGPDGNLWLSNNLGAEYARVGATVFDPTRQAGALDYTTTGAPLANPTADQIKKDWRAYGSLFQWQRNPDGHELINWSKATNGTPKYTGTGSISNSWTNAGTNEFIANASSPYSWVNSSLNSDSSQWNLWQTNGSTNPCPSGYHVPTHTEQVALHDAITGKSNGTNSSNSSAMWNETGLRLPASGSRYSGSGTLYGQSRYGRDWSSEQDNSDDSWNLWFNSSISSAGSNYDRARSFSVRCLKD